MANYAEASDRALIVIEDDPWLRALKVILDPDAPPQMATAFNDFMSTDEPDFAGWCRRVRASVPGLWPARVRMVETRDELLMALREATAVIVESMPIGAAELSAAPRLKVLQKYGALTRGIDLAACAAAQVKVLTLRRRANVACAEHAFALMLALARKIKSHANAVSERQLKIMGHELRPFDRRFTPNGNWGRVAGLRSLHGSTLGIIGFGEIGREIAIRAQAFDMNIVYHQRTRLDAGGEQALGVTYLTLDHLLARSDWLVPQLPASPATRRLIDADRIAQMKRGAVIVNVSRPDTMDRGALIEALRSGHLGGLGLDPPFHSPGLDDDELTSFENVIVTPHFAGSPRTNGLADFEDMIKTLEREITQ